VALTVSPALPTYLSGAHRQVDGWLDQHSANMIAGLSLYQRRMGLEGAIGEIGVHHGRLFILLALSAAPEETAFALDVFEHQELNVDQSGSGNRDMFYSHLRRNGLRPEDLTIITASSLDVSGEQLRERVGAIRMMSIDGGHTEECVLNDLGMADEALADHGIIIMDDVFNSTWPSVVSAYARYLLGNPATIPFASSPNKVYACRPDYVERYRGFLRRAFGRLYDRSDHFFGFEMDGYGMWANLSKAGS
jgi:hypothetical protein